MKVQSLWPLCGLTIPESVGIPGHMTFNNDEEDVVITTTKVIVVIFLLILLSRTLSTLTEEDCKEKREKATMDHVIYPGGFKLRLVLNRVLTLG